jgi:hypothetical protein
MLDDIAEIRPGKQDNVGFAKVVVSAEKVRLSRKRRARELRSSIGLGLLNHWERARAIL